MTCKIISGGIPIGHFQEREDAQEALKKYLKFGFIQEDE